MQNICDIVIKWCGSEFLFRVLSNVEEINELLSFIMKSKKEQFLYFVV